MQKPDKSERSKKIMKAKIAVFNARRKSRLPLNLCFSYSSHVITNAANAARNPNAIPTIIEKANIIS